MTRRFPVILYDSHCGICERSVAWLRRRDRAGAIRFVALDGPEGQQLLRSVGLPPEYRESLVYIEADGRHSTHSTGMLDALARLPRWRHAATALRPLPKGLRDTAYRWIARHRHRFGGPSTSCALPGKEE